MIGKLQAALDQLNACKTADEVADLMRSAGVKGDPSRCETCPIARFLSETGTRVWLGSDDEGAPVVVCGLHGDALVELGVLGDGPTEFIGQFDQHFYPDLIAPGKEAP